MKLLLFLFLIFSSYSYSQTAKEEKLNIAVLDIKPLGITPDESLILSEVLRSELFKLNLYRVMNREDMKEIMGEQAFQMTGLCDEKSCLIEIGKILKTEKIVTGSIGKLDSVYSITLKLIDIESTENEKLINFNEKCPKEMLFDLIKKTAYTISDKQYDIPKIPETTIEKFDEPVDLDYDLILFCSFNSNGKDRSRYRNDAKIQTAQFTCDKYGIEKNALIFNGKSTIVNCGNDPSLEINRNMSISVNFKIDSLPSGKNWQMLVYKNLSYQMYVNSQGQIVLAPSTRSLNERESHIYYKEIKSEPNALEASKWYNLSVVYDMDKRNFSIYLNNKLTTSTKISLMKMNISSEDLYIGSTPESSVSIFNGVIDDIRLYRRALNRTEIDSLYKIEEWRQEDLIHINGWERGASPVKDRFGNEKKARYRSKSSNDYDYNFLKYFDTSSDFSISFWFYQLSENPEGYMLIDKAVHGRSNGIILDTRGKDYPGRQLRWLPNYKPVYGNSKFTLNKWHNVVVTYDSKSTYIYLDGLLDGKSEHEVLIDKNDVPLYFGTTQFRMSEQDQIFDGYIDDVMIYTKVLKPKEVELLYHENRWK